MGSPIIAFTRSSSLLAGSAICRRLASAAKHHDHRSGMPRRSPRQRAPELGGTSVAGKIIQCNGAGTIGPGLPSTISLKGSCTIGGIGAQRITADSAGLDPECILEQIPCAAGIDVIFDTRGDQADIGAEDVVGFSL
jgi:hypothetical protein